MNKLDSDRESDLLAWYFNPQPANNLVSAGKTLARANLQGIIRANNQLKALLKETGGDIEVVRYELELLTRILYKIHNVFRNDHGYKSMRTLEKTLKKYLEFNYSRQVMNLVQLLPLAIEENPLLPPLAVAQFTLLALFVAIKTLHRICDCCRISGVKCLQRVSLGHRWGSATSLLGIISRIWAVSMKSEERLTKCAKLVAKRINPHLPSPAGAEFLPPHLYASLVDSILGCEGEPQLAKSTDYQKMKSADICNVEKEKVVNVDDVVAEADNNAIVSNVSSSSNFGFEYGIKVKRKPDASLDFGVKIRRVEDLPKSNQIESKASQINKASGNSPVRKGKASKVTKEAKGVGCSNESHSKIDNEKPTPTTESSKENDTVDVKDQLEVQLKAIHSFEDLNTFIENETAARKVAKRSTVTRSLSQDAWKSLRKELIKSFNHKTPNKSVKNSRKVIREAINVAN